MNLLKKIVSLAMTVSLMIVILLSRGRKEMVYFMWQPCWVFPCSPVLTSDTSSLPSVIGILRSSPARPHAPGSLGDSSKLLGYFFISKVKFGQKSIFQNRDQMFILKQMVQSLLEALATQIER